MMSWNKIGTFQIDQETSCQFADASGDYNPLHVDPVLARRYQFGATVIHGVCGTLNALDILLEQLGCPVFITSVKVQYTRPVMHGDYVDVHGSYSNEQSLKLRLSVQGRRTQDINLTVIKGSGKASLGPELKPKSVCHSAPADLLFKDTGGLKGQVDLVWTPDIIQSLFPNLKQYLPESQIAVLLGLTQIVGMRCPGLDSVFAGLTARFLDNQSICDGDMTYNVVHRDARFSLITIGVEHNTAQAEITALFRPKPVVQESYATLQTRVPKNQFSDQVALIIGGSRGIGEVTAKLIAAGGGHPLITYYKGKRDAQNIVDGIRSYGGLCDSVSYNVLSTSNSDISRCFENKRISHIYYFASPLIEKGDHSVWDDAVFQKFCCYYLRGFSELIEQFLSDAVYSKQAITVFVPSTVFLDQPQNGFSEYIAAKAASEALVRQLAAKYPNWKFHIPRLPRMLTDQTSGLTVEWEQKTTDIMFDVLTSTNQPIR